MFASSFLRLCSKVAKDAFGRGLAVSEELIAQACADRSAFGCGHLVSAGQVVETSNKKGCRRFEFVDKGDQRLETKRCIFWGS